MEHLTAWKAAMLMLTPFMRGRQMLRAWVAMFGASVAAYFVRDPVAYIAIDAIAAALVMARPSGLPQRAIGALFVLMLMFDLGFYLSPQANPGLFYMVLMALGWGQWAILAGWTGHDAWRNYRGWADPVGNPSVAHERTVR